MTYVIVHALAPIFVIMLLGFWAGKAKMVDNKNVSLLNIFVMDFALPAALFSATVQTPWTGIIAQSPLILVLTLAMWITYAAIYFLAASVFKKIAAGCGRADPDRGAAELRGAGSADSGQRAGRRVCNVAFRRGLYCLRFGTDDPVLPADPGA